MTEQIPDDDATAGRNPQEPPRRAPRGLEELARSGLKTKADDSRLGDLSEQYVRTLDRARAILGESSLAMALSRLAAHIRYLFSTANVMLFAQPADPVRQMAAATAKETIALDAKEKAMTLLHTGARKMLLPALLLVGAAFLIGGAINVWTAWRETEALIVDLEREKAEAAAIKIESFVDSIVRQVNWLPLSPRASSANLMNRKFEYVKLLKEVKEITEAAYIDAQGREQIRESRIGMSSYGNGKDMSDEPWFKAASAGRTYFGEVVYRKRTQPYMAIAVPIERRYGGGVTMVEVNVRFMEKVVRNIHVGNTGFAYIVDRRGRLIAHPDISLVLQKTDLSSLPQVQAVLPHESVAAGRASIVSEPRDLAGNRVTTASAHIKSLGWTVFVELPVAEARAPLWAALIRVASLLALGLLAIYLASVLAARRAPPAQPA
jgi:hypothetical protein